MKCDDYIENITLKNNIHELTESEVHHYENCKECSEKSNRYFSLFKSIEKEKQIKVDENITNLIIDKIENEDKIFLLRNEILKYAAVILISLLIGSISSILITNNNATPVDEELISNYFNNDENDFYVESLFMGLNEFDND